MSEVMINPNQVEEKAANMETLAKSMQAKVQEVHNLAGRLKEVWQDEVHEEFESSFTKLSASFEELINAIPGYANLAKSHAERMRQIGQNG